VAISALEEGRVGQLVAADAGQSFTRLVHNRLKLGGKLGGSGFVGGGGDWVCAEGRISLLVAGHGDDDCMMRSV
jgi:hypothetical protein